MNNKPRWQGVRVYETAVGDDEIRIYYTMQDNGYGVWGMMHDWRPEIEYIESADTGERIDYDSQTLRRLTFELEEFADTD